MVFVGLNACHGVGKKCACAQAGQIVSVGDRVAYNISGNTLCATTARASFCAHAIHFSTEGDKLAHHTVRHFVFEDTKNTLVDS